MLLDFFYFPNILFSSLERKETSYIIKHKSRYIYYKSFNIKCKACNVRDIKTKSKGKIKVIKVNN